LKVGKTGLYGLLLLLFILPSVLSITFYTDEEATLWASCKNRTYADSTAKITIRYPNGSMFIANDSMTVFSIGQFNYTFITPNTTGNYMSQVECNIGGIQGYDEDDFWVKEAPEEMTSLAVVIFIMVLTVGIFALPFIIKRFSENQYLDWTLKGICYIIGLFLLSLDTTMVVTVADNANLGITSELFMLLLMINWAAYIAMVVVVLGFGYKMVMLWRDNKQKDRMGYDDEY